MILFSLAGPTSQTSPLMVIWLRLLVKTISVKYVVIDRWSGQGRQCGGPWTAAHGMRLGSLATSCGEPTESESWPMCHLSSCPGGLASLSVDGGGRRQRGHGLGAVARVTDSELGGRQSQSGSRRWGMRFLRLFASYILMILFADSTHSAFTSLMMASRCLTSVTWCVNTEMKGFIRLKFSGVVILC
jgi:hypothetical protein